MTHPKVKRNHLKRKAAIYIRQSSLHQVIEHDESKRRQYQLVELAKSLGWKETACEIIDDDQAISATQSYNRPGYQRLTAMVALREVGLIVGLEVSRLARNCLDWYELLQIAAVFDVLVADEEGIYDLSQFNDRLLLAASSPTARARFRLVGMSIGNSTISTHTTEIPPMRRPEGAGSSSSVSSSTFSNRNGIAVCRALHWAKSSSR